MEQTLLDVVASLREQMSHATLHRSQLIDGILAANPTVGSSFLRDFSNEALKQYLDHLGWKESPRSADHRWVRPRGTPAIVWRDNDD